MKISVALSVGIALLPEIASAAGGFYQSCKNTVSSRSLLCLMLPAVCADMTFYTTAVAYGRQLDDCRVQENQRPVHEVPPGHEPVHHQLVRQTQGRDRVRGTTKQLVLTSSS